MNEKISTGKYVAEFYQPFLMWETLVLFILIFPWVFLPYSMLSLDINYGSWGVITSASLIVSMFVHWRLAKKFDLTALNIWKASLGVVAILALLIAIIFVGAVIPAGKFEFQDVVMAMRILGLFWLIVYLPLLLANISHKYRTVK